MKKILILNGESYWPEYLPGFEVHQKKIQSTDWVLRDGELYALDPQGVLKPDAILWRVGAIKPLAKHRAALELIQLSGIPCVNDAAVLLQGYDRLTMLGVLKACNLPVIPFQAVTNPATLKNIKLTFPFVVKSGNYHGGFGKVLVRDADQWQDVQDLLFMSEDYVTTEPYIAYDRDIRYLAIGDQIWAMARRGKFWKANVETTDFVVIESDAELVAQTQTLQKKLRADIVAIDILEEKSGQRYFVEYNDIPGLSGFPEQVRVLLAERLTEKLRALSAGQNES
jgi:ribosomal protein S6--L-glutamate ligase